MAKTSKFKPSTIALILFIISFNSFNLFKCEEPIPDGKVPSILFNNISNTNLETTTILDSLNDETTTVLINKLSDEIKENSESDPSDLEEQVTKKVVISSKPNSDSEEELDKSKPLSCSDMKVTKSSPQPVYTSTSYLKKCCPMGESLHSYDVLGGKSCDTENQTFDPKLITAVLYDHCIEDLEEQYEIEVEVGNPCNVSFIYKKEYGDKMYVMQNGSLLLMDLNGNTSYDIFDDYCMDVDYETGEMMAIVCVTPIDAKVVGAQAYLYAIFMSVSVLCLTFVAYIHFAIRELRTVHGLSLACMSSCLAIGFTLYIFAQIFYGDKGSIGYFIQFFIISYFCWLFMMATNIVVTVWYFLPRYKTITRFIRYTRLSIYFGISTIIPLTLVLKTYMKRLPGMPSYFYQGWSESIQESQKYFIPPVSILLCLTFCMLVISYFGFRECGKILLLRNEYRAISSNFPVNQNQLPIMDEHFLEETKQDATCISILLGIIAVTWLLEVVTFYSPGSEDYMAFMEIMNGLQGFFILLIFIVQRKRRSVIIRWWHDRGSHEITPLPKHPPPNSDSDTKEEV